MQTVALKILNSLEEVSSIEIQHQFKTRWTILKNLVSSIRAQEGTRKTPEKSFCSEIKVADEKSLDKLILGPFDVVAGRF